MSCLTNKQYFQTYKKLKSIWNRSRYVYSYLKPTEQWHLHDYFQPYKDLAKDELLAHREAITKERPSLPHQAGRAFAKLNHAVVYWAINRQLQPIVVGKRTNMKRKVVIVGSIVQPEIDTKKIATVLIRLARQWQAEQNEVQGKDDRAA